MFLFLHNMFHLYVVLVEKDFAEKKKIKRKVNMNEWFHFI